MLALVNDRDLHASIDVVQALDGTAVDETHRVQTGDTSHRAGHAAQPCLLYTSSRHVIVTGASRGIGAAIAEFFIAAGDRVVALSRSGTGPEGCALVLAVDVTDSSAVNEAVKRAVGELGPVDVAVINAGVTKDGLAMRMSDEQWRRCV